MGEEAFAGNTYLFGNSDKPYLYHYFNDTVFVFTKDLQLNPHHLLKVGNGMLTYDFLAGKTKMSTPGIQVSGMWNATDYVFIKYNGHLGLYSLDFKVFYPNVILKNKEYPELSVSAGDVISQGLDEKSVIIIKQAISLTEANLPFPVNESDNPILVKYVMK